MKDDGRIPRIKDTDMTDRLLTAGAIAEDTRNPIGDIAACFPFRPGVRLSVAPGGAAVADALDPAPRGRSRYVVLGPDLPGGLAVLIQLHDLPLERLLAVAGMPRAGHRRPPIPRQSSLIGLSNTL